MKKNPLYAAIRKYGYENFELTPIESYTSEQDADEAEEFWIHYFNTRSKTFGYNLAAGGRVNRGNKWSKEKREKRKAF
jgi:hypothetical protein